MIKILIILLLLYVVKTYYIYKLRSKRDNLDLTVPSNKLMCKDINNTINLLNGDWLWTLARKK